MRLTKRHLKRIIREEYSRLKRRGLITESERFLGLDETDAGEMTLLLLETWERDWQRYQLPGDKLDWCKTGLEHGAGSLARIIMNVRTQYAGINSLLEYYDRATVDLYQQIPESELIILCQDCIDEHC